MVAKARFAANVDRDDVLSLGVFETGKDDVDGTGGIGIAADPGRRRLVICLLYGCCSQCLSFPTRTSLSYAKLRLTGHR